MNGKDVRVGVSLLVNDMENMVQFYRYTRFSNSMEWWTFCGFWNRKVENCLYLCIAGKNLKTVREDYIFQRVSIRHLKSPLAIQFAGGRFGMSVCQSWVCSFHRRTHHLSFRYPQFLRSWSSIQREFAWNWKYKWNIG